MNSKEQLPATENSVAGSTWHMYHYRQKSVEVVNEGIKKEMNRFPLILLIEYMSILQHFHWKYNFFVVLLKEARHLNCDDPLIHVGVSKKRPWRTPSYFSQT